LLLNCTQAVKAGAAEEEAAVQVLGDDARAKERERERGQECMFAAQYAMSFILLASLLTKHWI